MSQATARKLGILEPVSVFGMIMVYIWALRYTHHEAWMGILGLMLVSHILRREGAVGLGFRTANLRGCLEEFAPVLALLALSMLAFSAVFETTRPIGPDAVFLAWAAYLPWGLFQQYVLNGYFLTRFDAVLAPARSSLLAAVLFACVHLPNWFLMLVAFPGAWASTIIYRKTRNLYFLGIAHATIGVLLLVVVPDSVSHHLKIGPGWYAR